MTVQELINHLNVVEDKSKQAYVFVGSERIDIVDIAYVDELNDRVDINVFDESE